MLLAVDIGNTTTKLGFFDQEELKKRLVIPTPKEKSTRELYKSFNKENPSFSNVIISSVVPEINSTFRKFFNDSFAKEPVFVDYNLNLDISLKYNPPESLGTDRLINAFSALEKYQKTCIICDFGTATTIDAVSENRVFLGGVIVPGISILPDALSTKTSKLPKVEISTTTKVIGNSTSECIQSGIFHGYIGLVESLISKMKQELNEEAFVVATGGWASFIKENTDLIESLDENLTLEGLYRIFKKTLCCSFK